MHKRNLVVTVVAAGIALWAAPSAGAASLEAPFTLDEEGFVTATFDQNGENGDNGPSDFVATGGNPDGFIRYTDADFGSSEFLARVIVPITTGTADYGGTISYDMQSTAVTPSPNGANFILIAGQSGSVYCELAMPGATWSPFSATIDAANPCWLNGEDSTDASQAQIEAALDLGQVQLNPDISEDVSEVTDLDNFSFQGSSDTTPPDTTIESGPADGSTISDTTPTFELSSSEPGSTFLCEIDDGGAFPCTSPYSDTFADGTYTIEFAAVDASSNIDPTPATRTFTIDTSGANEPPVLDPIGDKTATVGTELTFQASATDPDADLLTFAIFNEPTGATIDPGTGLFSWTPEAGDVGTHTVDIEVSDGTDADDETITITVSGDPGDTTPPETTIESGPAEGSTIPGTMPEFAFSSNEAGSTFECKVDGGAFTACNSPQEIGPLANGSHTFQVRATDAAGNVDATPASRTFTVDTGGPDTTPPETTITSGPADGSTITTDSASFEFSSNEAGSTFECKLDGGAFEACTSPENLTGLADGSHTFQVRATDAAANLDATPASRTFTVDTGGGPDTTPPETTITAGPPEGSTITNNSPSFEFTSNEANSTFECSLDFGAYAACTSPRNLTALADGSHTFSVRATDAAGNDDASPASRTFTVDAGPPPDETAPEVTIDKIKGKAKKKTAKLEFTGTDDTSAAADLTFTCQIDDSEPVPCTSPHTFTKVKPGTHAVQVIATDEAGNESDEAIDTFKQKKKKKKK